MYKSNKTVCMPRHSHSACVCVCCLNQFGPTASCGKTNFVAVSWARPKVRTSNLSPAQATTVIAKKVGVQD